MLSICKNAQLATMAALIVLLGATAAPTMASAAKGDQSAQGDRDRKDVKKSKAQKSQVTKRHVTTKTVVRDERRHARPVKRHVNTRVVVRTRTTAVYVPYVVIGTPVAYRAYGSGYCRALHRGRHWAPGMGWHAGQHVGRVRC